MVGFSSIKVDIVIKSTRNKHVPNGNQMDVAHGTGSIFAASQAVLTMPLTIANVRALGFVKIGTKVYSRVLPVEHLFPEPSAVRLRLVPPQATLPLLILR